MKIGLCPACYVEPNLCVGGARPPVDIRTSRVNFNFKFDFLRTALNTDCPAITPISLADNVGRLEAMDYRACWSLLTVCVVLRRPGSEEKLKDLA